MEPMLILDTRKVMNGPPSKGGLIGRIRTSLVTNLIFRSMNKTPTSHGVGIVTIVKE